MIGLTQLKRQRCFSALENREHYGSAPGVFKQDCSSDALSCEKMHSTTACAGLVPSGPNTIIDDESPEHVALPSKNSPAHPCIKKWIFDSGCGVDLASKKDIKGFERRIREAEETLDFRTASGRTEADSMIRVQCSIEGHPIRAYILQSTLAVVSMVKRCMEEGCSFVWLAGGSPFLIDKQDRVRGEGQRSLHCNRVRCLDKAEDPQKDPYSSRAGLCTERGTWQ
jgi:hypothetical protein